jgi:hypothetical protein
MAKRSSEQIEKDWIALQNKKDAYLADHKAKVAKLQAEHAKAVEAEQKARREAGVPVQEVSLN